MSFVGEERSNKGVAQSPRGSPRWQEPGFADRFWCLWDKHRGHQAKVAEELGVSPSTVNHWKQYVRRSAPQTPEAAAAEKARLSDKQRGNATNTTGEPLRRNSGKRILTPAGIERSSQELRSAPELARRGGKSFWDETGRAEATERDRAAVQRLFGRPRED